MTSLAVWATAQHAAARASTSAPAAVGFVTINGAGQSPLKTIHIGDEMSFQILHRTVPGAGQIYPSNLNSPADMGVFVRTGIDVNTLYAPNFAMHGGTATVPLGPTTPWTPVSISAPTGNGNPGTPYTYVVTADAGTTGLRLETTVTYLNSENFFRHNLKFSNLGAHQITFDAFLASDIYLAGTDSGIPHRVATTNSVGGQDCVNQNYTILHIPITPCDFYSARRFSDVWTLIRNGDLDNVVAPGCIDNGAGLEWKERHLMPGESLTIQSATSFGDIPTIANNYVGVNKDLTNGTGQLANDVEILLEGNFPPVKSHFDGGFPNFTQTAVGSNTLLHWSGMNVAAGALVHVGFEVWGTSAKILSVTWTFNGVGIGCARQCNTLYGTHSSGTKQIEYANDVLGCAAVPLFAGNLSVEYYATPPPLAALNPQTPRAPMAVDVIAGPSVLIAPNQSQAVLIPDPPFGALYTVIVHKVGTDPLLLAPDTTHDFVLQPIDTPPVSLPTTYCTAGTTTNGCVPSISGNAHPSVSSPSMCQISIANVEGQKNGIVFYGLQPHSAPWAPGSSSFLCVKPPTQRTPAQPSGGTPNACNGTLTLDWDAFQASHPGALGQPWSAGQLVFVQGWFRDPPASKTTNLSDGLKMLYLP